MPLLKSHSGQHQGPPWGLEWRMQHHGSGLTGAPSIEGPPTICTKGKKYSFWE